MLEDLASPEPLAVLLIGFPLLVIVLAIAYVLAARAHVDHGARADAAFSLGQGAIFGLIALILGFSFAFAAGRYDARRTLIVAETSAIGTTLSRSDILVPAQRPAFRRLLAEYAQSRLDAYTALGDAPAEAAALDRAAILQSQLWNATMRATTDHHDAFLPLLVYAVNDMSSRAEQQTAALNNHLPPAIFGLVVVCALTGALVLGLAFGRGGTPHIAIALLYCMLCTSTVCAISDLDHAHGGLIQLDAGALQRSIDAMKRT